MLKLNHKNLKVWSESLTLVKMIYDLTKLFPQNEKFGLISQLNRAVVSVTSNIAEGSARSSNLDRKRFYQIARSSLVEIDTQLKIALLLNIISRDNIKNLDDQLN